MKIVINIDAGSQFCEGCKFGKRGFVDCNLFNQRRSEIGKKMQRLTICLSAEEMAENL